MGKYRSKMNLVLALFVVVIMVFSSAFTVGNLSGSQHRTASNTVYKSSPSLKNDVLSQLDQERFSPVPAAPSSVEKGLSASYNGSISVMITFSFNNQSRLNSLLSNLSNPESTGYHRFITRSQFASNFSVSPQVYSHAVSYLSQYPGLNVRTYADRVSIEVTGPAKRVGDLFNTTIVAASSDSSVYSAAVSPELPASLAPYVSEVTGLSNSHLPIHYNRESKQISLPQIKASSVDNGYPTPVDNSGVQYIYGSDLQVAYDEQSLLNITYPTNEVIATILWAGTNSSGNPVGAFDPSDIYAYYNATLPSYEPHAKVFGVPLNGAAKPGVSASYDTTGANQENTLDLEMVGSTAPGASIYNVYGPNSTYESIDSAFAYILNPNSTYKALNNVSVITNSWGGAQTNSTVWFQYLQEAQARGISVLASSGDSGDNTASSKYVGSTVEFPSAMAYNDFGVTAVGGDTLTLADNLHILSETAWYISSADGGPAGSTGGISSVFKEPVWQLDSEANDLLNGQGRGVPDISAIANNTFVYMTVDGVPYYGSQAFTFWGTSVASPVEAGIIAEMDAVLNHYNQSNLGYLNPLIYSLANKQVAPMQTTSFTGYIQTGSYNSTLPTLPFYNVMYGHNHVYNATYGYNLVTGWGSIDAYNMSMYVLNINRNLSLNGLRGVDNQLVINDLNVTSYIYDPSTSTYYVNTFYNASIQQNLFLANQYGAPIYWIQNVVYINGSQTTGWVVNYSGWVVYPFFGQYPSQTVYEYNFPLGKTIFMPHTFNVRTWITNLSEPMQQTVNFEVNSHIVTLPVPGAAYIIDAYNYSYALQGHTYYNGPFPDNQYYGGLNPQFGLIGGPSSGLGIFAKPTSGSVSAYAEPLDMNIYVPAITKVFNESIDETGESAEFLNFNSVNASSWTISINNGSFSQGIVDYAPSQYSQVFQENGLPSGTSWSVDISGTEYTSTSTQITIPLVNGSYTAQVSSPAGYFASPSTYIFTVDGQPGDLPVTYAYSSNETYIKPVATIYPVNGQILPGNALNITYFNKGQSSFGMAYDNSTGMLLVPEYIFGTDTGEIYVYSTVTGQFVKTISIPSYDAVYDPSTGYVYAMSFSGNISEINPSTFAIVKNLTLTASINNITILQGQGSFIYALSTSGNISQIDPSTMAVVKTIEIFPGRISSFFSTFFSVHGENAYVANPTGNDLLVVNFTTSAIKDVYLPPHYDPMTVIHYSGSELLIGGENYSDRLYNVSTGSLTAGPFISGIAVSSIYDPLSNTEFIFSASFTLDSFGNITDVNPGTGKILATIPGVVIQLSPIFNSADQNIYVEYYGGSVSEYSVQHFYAATFTESELPPGTTWYANLTDGISSGAITGTSYSFSLINGTYSYTIATSDKIYEHSPSSDSFTINGASVSESIAFSKVTYTANFTESGLPSGMEWYVNGTGITGHVLSPANMSFDLTNGTYSFTATNLSGYYTTTTHFSVVINGRNVTDTVDYYHWAYIAGKVLPTNATLTINGKAVLLSSSGSFNVSVANGTYHVVASSTGYTSYYSNFSLNSGNVKDLTINLKQISKSSPLSNTELYAIIGVVVAIVVTAGVIFALRRRK